LRNKQAQSSSHEVALLQNGDKNVLAELQDGEGKDASKAEV
jgi:hypothetical protein